jgi:hypothetical protein
VLTHYSITADDYVQAQRAHLRRKGAPRFSYLLSRIVMPIAFLVVLLVSILRPEEFQTLMPGLLFTGIFSAIIFAHPFLWRRQFAKIPPSQMQVTAEFSEKEVHFQSAKTDSVAQWEHFVGWRESRDLFLLYQRTNLFNMVPKRAFTPEQLTEFRELLARKIPQMK